MTIKRILVPTDFGAASSAALSYARDLADATGATLYLLHVVDDLAASFGDYPFPQFGEVQTSMEAEARAELDELARAQGPRAPEPHTAILTSTATASAIAGYAAGEHIDLIVMGTHGRVPLVRMFLGAVADRVIRTAPCPVLTVREPKSDTRHDEEREYEARALVMK